MDHVAVFVNVVPALDELRLFGVWRRRGVGNCGVTEADETNQECADDTGFGHVACRGAATAHDMESRSE
jgi:hypothetical protein